MLVTLKSADDPDSARVLLDPNTLDAKGKTTIDFFTPSPDGTQANCMPREFVTCAPARGAGRGAKRTGRQTGFPRVGVACGWPRRVSSSPPLSAGGSPVMFGLGEVVVQP